MGIKAKLKREIASCIEDRNKIKKRTQKTKTTLDYLIARKSILKEVLTWLTHNQS